MQPSEHSTMDARLSPDLGKTEYPGPLLTDGQWLYVQDRFGLTYRERQIAELVCRGLRNGTIAARLHIKPGTVKTHIRNIYRKVHATSKIEMLLKFVSEARQAAPHPASPPDRRDHQARF